MLTGKNRRISANISDHLMEDKGYEVVNCDASSEKLEKSWKKNPADIIIICLSDEDRESVRIFDILSECAGTEILPVIVVANNEDLNTFNVFSHLRNIRFLPRPVSILDLYSLLFEIEKSMGEDLKKRKPVENRERRPGEKNLPVRKHILIVDDDPEQLEEIKKHLFEFYDVTAVRSGAAAFKYLENHEVDLVLLDYIMPVMDGPEVLYRMRTKRALSQLPVIFLTGVSEREKVIKTLVELRPQGYIIKPAKKSEIVAKIIDVLG